MKSMKKPGKTMSPSPSKTQGCIGCEIINGSSIFIGRFNCCATIAPTLYEYNFIIFSMKNTNPTAKTSLKNQCFVKSHTPSTKAQIQKLIMFSTATIPNYPQSYSFWQRIFFGNLNIRLSIDVYMATKALKLTMIVKMIFRLS